MEGFGRYAVLHQAHARANAQKTATQKRKDAAREVTDRGMERRDRDAPAAKAERLTSTTEAQEASNLRPSRPVTADAWSMLLPNGPAPGESDRGYIVRRHALEQNIRDDRQAAKREAALTAKTNTAPLSGNRIVQAILDRKAAASEAGQAKEAQDKEKWLGARVADD